MAQVAKQLPGADMISIATSPARVALNWSQWRGGGVTATPSNTLPAQRHARVASIAALCAPAGVRRDVFRGLCLFTALRTAASVASKARIVCGHAALAPVTQMAAHRAAHLTGIQMTESASRLEHEQARAIATLSDKLHVPVHEVGEIYKKEFARLAKRARIPTFLVVLAMSNTRSILRGGGRSATLR